MHGEKFYQLHTETTTAVVTSEYTWKPDPSEVERTYNIRKQQTRFKWVWNKSELRSVIYEARSVKFSSSIFH